MEKFKILPGLPAYGDLPEQFSATGIGTHQEGLVVQISSFENRASGVGNFQPGLTSLDEVLEHPDGSSMIVVSGGECYIVDIERRSLKETFGGVYETIFRVPEKNIVIFGSSIDFDSLNSSGHLWQSRRISWHGIRHLNLEDDTLMGEAWSFEDSWIPFSLDVNTGAYKGGTKID